MIVPGGKPTSSHDGEDLPPPSYQESVPSPQLIHGERPTASLYAPPVSSRSGFSYESEGGSGIGFPEPTIPDGGINSEPPPLPPRDREKAEMRDGPGQRAFGAFSSMVWGTSATPSTSRSPNLAGSPNQDPLNPAPSAFTRPTPKNYAYLPFQAMTMLGIGSNLAGGFPTIPPPINPEDERQVGRANPQHPFVSHDVTEEDWSGFLAGIQTVASRPSQTQKSFLARLFLSEMNERDQRKSVVHFIDAWNHYFFHPRRLTVVLARGRRIFSGSSGNHLHRRHSIGGDRGRDTNPSHVRGHNHRSHSTDSSSSSDSSESSVSTTSGPHEMPVPHPHTDYGFERGSEGSIPGMGMGRGWGRGGRGRGFGGPFHPGWHGGRGGRGWCSPGPGAVPPIHGQGGGSMGRGGPWESHPYHEQKQAWRVEKRAWKVEKRAAKREYRQAKHAMKHERRQRRRAAKAMRHYGGQGAHKRDQPWKLIVTFRDIRRDSGQS